MEHILRLHPDPFDRIKSWSKTLEIRLFDEKRQQMKIWDIVVFEKRPDFKEILKAEIVEVLRFKSFSEIPENFSYKELWMDENYDKKQFSESYYEYYTREDEEKYWVVVFRLEILL